MDSLNNEWNYEEEDIAHKFYFFNVLKDSRVHLLFSPKPGSKIIPPVDDLFTGVKIRDVVLSDDVSVRMFLPGDVCSSTKLPVLFYVHGGGFCFCSAFSVDYTGYLTRLVAECNVIAVSVEYGLFPARPMPACYDDCWFALQWLTSHADPNICDQSADADTGPHDPWITDYADLNRIFAGGDSAGGNICHNLLSRVGKVGLPKGLKVEGMILIHPYFGINDKMWMYMCPTNEGPRDPRMRPAGDDLARLGCKRVLVLVAEKDMLKDVGVKYVKELKKSGWKGNVELFESKNRKHCFLISKYLDPEAIAVNQRIKSFINRDYVA
ncbi:2-hydroxyisoflavanone dehydratase-like [Silene latifolia]|uniref:2-hydroxyisoflavanone dehydratase-like n=1 Tax=Silene latifolia TaxID=37657 RepID=UPI003D77B31E